MALYQRSQQYVTEIKEAPQELKNDIKELEAAIEGSQFSAHAHHVLEGEVQEDDGIVTKQFKSKTVSSVVIRCNYYSASLRICFKFKALLKIS